MRSFQVTATCAVAFSVAGFLAPVTARSENLDGNVPPIAWTCMQSHDAAYHVVCRPSCRSDLSGHAADSPAGEAIAVRPAWGKPAVFRSKASPAAVIDTGNGDITAADCRRDTRRSPRIPASASGSAPHLVPVAERHITEIFTGRPWSVPLYSRPSDPNVVTRLLREVLCRSPNAASNTTRPVQRAWRGTSSGPTTIHAMP